MSAEISEVPNTENARARLKQRDDAIRANGIKQGRSLERAEIMEALGVKTLEEAGTIGAIRTEHEAELERVHAQHEREEKKHGKGMWWQGALIGGMVAGAGVAIGAAIYTDALIDNVFDASGKMRAQSDITDAIERERQRELPP